MLVGTEDLKITDYVTLRGVDKMKLEDISDTIQEFVDKLKNQTELNCNRRNRLSRLLPTL